MLGAQIAKRVRRPTLTWYQAFGFADGIHEVRAVRERSQRGRMRAALLHISDTVKTFSAQRIRARAQAYRYSAWKTALG